MTSMEKGTIKLTVKFPNQQIKDQKVILCASQDAGKSGEPSDSESAAKQQENNIEQFASDVNSSVKDLEKNEEAQKNDDSKESTSSAGSEKSLVSESEEASTSKGTESSNEKAKEHFSWDARTFANFSEQQIQSLNEYQRVWIQHAYQNYLAQHMHYYSTLGLNAPNATGYAQPQNFYPYYRGNHTLRSDQQIQTDSQQNGTTNQDNQSNTNANTNNNNNNVQNNNHAEDNAENLDNRDWLDNFYMLSRVIILFSIVYFYSSPLRFMLVTLLGFMIYLYHHGFFRPPQIMLPNNENNAAANVENNDVNQEDENQVPGNQQPPQNQPANERETVNGTDGDNENNEERPGVAALAWIFLSSFFASLIPD